MENEKWKEYLNAVFGDNLSEKDLEKMFLANSADAFAIYQLHNHENTRDYRFLPLERLEAAGRTVDRDNYEPVYTADLTNAQDKPVPQLLIILKSFVSMVSVWQSRRKRPVLNSTARKSKALPMQPLPWLAVHRSHPVMI